MEKNWKIEKLNIKIKKVSDLIPGTIISYKASSSMPIQPEGLPYLIKIKDTLPKIAIKVYLIKKDHFSQPVLLIISQKNNKRSR